jgi:GT2 family glycosyltransferase
MSNISCVIIAASKSRYHIDITKQAIISSGVDCIVVETHAMQPYKEAKVNLFWPKEFNYNACLNFGITHTETEYIALCNNDLVFKKDWQKITEHMKENNVLSASPFSNYSQHRHGYKPDGSIKYGYWVGHELLGWCIVIHRDLLGIIGKLDESRKFWCSDDVYSDQLRTFGIKHMLDCGSVVDHIGGGSKTLNTMPSNVYRDFTTNEYNRYQYAKKNKRVDS